ncbi:hypothetical protein BGZ65_009044, partial [Modicella reniformis]
MTQTGSFITFHDLTPAAHFLWASPSAYDVLGYEPEDLLGRSAYEIVYPDDKGETGTAHKENLINDLVATQLVLRYKSKKGEAILCLAIFGVCYDFIVACITQLDQGAEE